MKYRVIANLFFDTEADAKKVFDEMTLLEGKINNINEEKVNPEISSFNYHKCYHDEEPSKPCEIIRKTTKLSDRGLEKVDNTV